jgi:hypothetical protein
VLRGSESAVTIASVNVRALAIQYIVRQPKMFPM